MALGKAIVILCGLLYFLSCVHGMLSHGNQRCMCRGKVAEKIHFKSLKKVEVYPISFGCEKVEVVATMKSGVQKCLNPESESANKLFSAIRKKR
ncbi:hypothetical protein GDO86_000793 [Hymenochirus boettgeri]|uniref:Chemokine interleukin-8-like domain-containing protein n=1 Tax=Hymenochirus boettgeri TaxID=247094 RepID=A0A8T2KAW5_9PIPI|nr:hypothetical protein GDO86_000793 [Hymenochirus boettgeri]